ncbi:MAG: transketolase [Propionibacteriaceae bacterium]|nr:transketolase [Propionibacteriaceae bacterium]
MAAFQWSELDAKAVDTARILAADSVEKVGNGHPGTAISIAPLAYLLYQKVMTFDPADPTWLGRDRFVLSIGHSSITQYAQLYLSGCGLELDDLKAFRTRGSLTPGHPEYGHTPGVECTTGPLGAGVSNAVGFAMAARKEQALFDPSATAGESIFDHYVYCVAGDGDMQEGVAGEAASLAATQELGNLIVIYDDNRISIEGDTAITFSEDVVARHQAYGWDVHSVDFTHGGTGYEEKVEELFKAIEKAKAVADKPSFIKVTTVIGWPLPTKAGTAEIHGSKIGADEVAALKSVLGFDPAKSFEVADEVVNYTRTNAAHRAQETRAIWDKKYDQWAKANQESKKLLDRILAQEIPDLEGIIEPYEAETRKSTRAASGETLTALADTMPELWGGSADLGGSNNTTMKGKGSFLPASRGSSDWTPDPNGRVLHFGIREHAMGGILNALNSGLTRAYGGTFLVFADYMRTPIRLAALSGVPSIFVFTHDSIGVGEDGPTHQPIEQIASLRLIPNLDVIRPADANEVVEAWKLIADNHDHPSALILSRQDLDVISRAPCRGFAPASDMIFGAYTLLASMTDEPQVVLVATGSEVEIALEARDGLQELGIGTSVVSAPCLEWFAEQDQDYREMVLPPHALKVSIEAGVTAGWSDIVGSSGITIGIDHFGACAPGAELYREYGLTKDDIVARVRTSLGI